MGGKAHPTEYYARKLSIHFCLPLVWHIIFIRFSHPVISATTTRALKRRRPSAGIELQGVKSRLEISSSETCVGRWDTGS